MDDNNSTIGCSLIFIIIVCIYLIWYIISLDNRISKIEDKLSISTSKEVK